MKVGVETAMKGSGTYLDNAVNPVAVPIIPRLRHRAAWAYDDVRAVRVADTELNDVVHADERTHLSMCDPWGTLPVRHVLLRESANVAPPDPPPITDALRRSRDRGNILRAYRSLRARHPVATR